MGGLWLGAPPNLLFVPDRDGDDVADGDIEVRLTGWGIRDRHETLNSFLWGPDGWLYGCQGFATPSKVGKPVGGGKLFKHRDPFPKDIPLAGDGVDIDGGVWRYHPTKDRFEVVAHGFSNPWGIDYDATGQLFISACVIPHLWHVIPGGIYHRQGGRHFNPHVYADIRTITDHRHRSAHGGARVYQSDAFPEKYRGRIFMANIHEHAVLTDVLEPRGSGFIGRHGDDFLHANNAQWIGFSMEIGPEGNVYVLDWHDADICGKDVLHKDTGRVFRIAPEESFADPRIQRPRDVAALSNGQLVELQLSPSNWHARRARVVLQERASRGRVDDDTFDALREIFRNHEDVAIRLRAMWALHVAQAWRPEELLGALADDAAPVRAWAVQLLTEDFDASPEALRAFEKLAGSDSSAVVRLYLAAALQRIAHRDRWSLASALVQREEDADDHNIPKMLWFGIEPLVADAPGRAMVLAAASRIPLVARHIARRLGDAGKLGDLVAGIAQAGGDRLELLRGFSDALDRRGEVSTPKGWPELYANLRVDSNAETARYAVALAQRFGDEAAGAALLEALTDESVRLSVREGVLRQLAERRVPELRAVMLDYLKKSPLRRQVIRAIAHYDDEALADAILAAYPTFGADEKLDAVQTLASRSRFGWKLTQAIRGGSVPRRDIPAYVARQLKRVVGSGFVEVWGPIDALAGDKKAVYEKFRKLLTDNAVDAASPSRGRAVFETTCGACHRMYGVGGRIGPDITGANRTDLDYVLSNILSPSEVIQDAYRMVLILTDEGRLYSGILAEESERHVALRVTGQDEPVSIAKSSIVSREVAPVSMMPEGLLATLTNVEVLDLVAYLRTSEQVALPNSQ